MTAARTGGSVRTGGTRRGRGAAVDPKNRFETTVRVADLEHVADDAEYLAALERPPTTYIADASRSIVSENDSPDISFRYSVNPYRGCEHGCAYCYARPTHEYLGHSGGLDFETVIYVKEDAPRLFKERLAKKDWTGEPVAFSGVTDCYQPIEREKKLTRGCLEVARDHGQPVTIVTKNALVTRDVDILSEMASLNIARVGVSITTLDAALARSLEPRTSSPAARLRAIGELSAAGIPVRVMAAPIIPGLNDEEIPAILEAAAAAGATAASYVMLRLPWSVRPVFLDWLDRCAPTKAGRVRSRIGAVRGGELNETRFSHRHRGEGVHADSIARTFAVFAKRHGLAKERPPLSREHFRRPDRGRQKRLFG